MSTGTGSKFPYFLEANAALQKFQDMKTKPTELPDAMEAILQSLSSLYDVCVDQQDKINELEKQVKELRTSSRHASMPDTGVSG